MKHELFEQLESKLVPDDKLISELFSKVAQYDVNNIGEMTVVKPDKVRKGEATVKSRKGLIISAAAAIALTFGVVLFLGLHNIMNNNISEPKSSAGDENTGNEPNFLQASPTDMLCPEASNTSYSNGFVYYGVKDGIVEYDTESMKYATITPKVTKNTVLSDFTSYNGFIYAVKREYDDSQTATGSSDKYTIVRIDYNSGEVTEVYTPDNSSDIIGCMSVSKDGMMYFSQGHFESGDNDAEGYNKGFGIYEMDIESGSKKKLESGNTYYIDSDRIYFTKLNEKTDSCRLFYADMSDLENVTDTGLDVVRECSKDTPYMYYPADDKIYWSGSTNKLMCYDIGSGKSDTVCEFDEDSYVRYFQHWNGKMLVLVREKMPESRFYQYGLYYLDKDNKAVKITDDTMLNEGRQYTFEWIDYMTIWNDCDEYFLLSTYNPACDRKAYLVDKDFNMTMIAQDGEWDYEAYEKEQMSIGG